MTTTMIGARPSSALVASAWNPKSANSSLRNEVRVRNDSAPETRTLLTTK